MNLCSGSLVRAIGGALRHQEYETRQGSVLFPKIGALAQGRYFHSINGKELQEDCNLIPDAAILSVLGVFWGVDAKVPAWYLALYGGAVTPAASWTATNFAANATEITSGTEGYAELTRPQWTPDVPAAGVIGNLTNKAQFTIATASTLVVNGAALLSNNTKGGTSGIVSSAARFANPRSLFTGDVFELGYSVTLTG